MQDKKKILNLEFPFCLAGRSRSLSPVVNKRVYVLGFLFLRGSGDSLSFHLLPLRYRGYHRVVSDPRFETASPTLSLCRSSVCGLKVLLVDHDGRLEITPHRGIWTTSRLRRILHWLTRMQRAYLPSQGIHVCDRSRPSVYTNAMWSLADRPLRYPSSPQRHRPCRVLSIRDIQQSRR